MHKLSSIALGSLLWWVSQSGCVATPDEPVADTAEVAAASGACVSNPFCPDKHYKLPNPSGGCDHWTVKYVALFQPAPFGVVCVETCSTPVQTSPTPCFPNEPPPPEL